MKKYVRSAVLPLRDEDPQALVSILQDEIDPEQLEEITQHPSWVVKLAIIENPCVTRRILQTLCNDSNGVVRAAAEYRLKEMGR